MTYLHFTGGDAGPTVPYAEWSGFWSVWIPPILSVSAAYVLYRWHNQCHVGRCFRVGKHPFQHYKLCKKHHPEVPKKLTHLHIKKLHVIQLKHKE